MDKPIQLHERPGYKRVPITIVFHMFETIQDDPDDDGRFFIEENHCIDNYIRDLFETQQRHEHPSKPLGVCSSCSRAEAYLGHIPFDAIHSIQPEPGTTNPNARDLEGSKEDPWAAERKAEEAKK